MSGPLPTLTYESNRAASLTLRAEEPRDWFVLLKSEERNAEAHCRAWPEPWLKGTCSAPAPTGTEGHVQTQLQVTLVMQTGELTGWGGEAQRWGFYRRSDILLSVYLTWISLFVSHTRQRGQLGLQLFCKSRYFTGSISYIPGSAFVL